ncbi:YIP1 family protein [Candidatus Pyrohabitans sp.]
MIGIIVKPKSFISENLNHRYSLKKPLALVSFISILGGISGFLIMRKLMDSLPGEIHSIFMVGSGIGLLFGILGGIAMWAIMTAFFHIPAVLMGGGGDYRKLLELVGYAQVPLVFSSLVALLVIAEFSPDLTPELMRNRAAVEQAFLSVPAFKASRGFGRLMLFWSLCLSVIAVREVYGISTKKAAISVFIPVLLYAAISEGIKRWIGI